MNTDAFKLFAEEEDEGEGEDESEGEDEGEEEDKDDGLEGKIEAEFLDREHLRAVIAQQDPHLLRAIGHQFEDFVVHCTYRGVYCG